MTDLEKEAIETIKEKVFNYNLNKKIGLLDKMTEQGRKECETLETVLNLIERQQREKELHIKLEQQYKKEYLDAKEEIEKYKYLYQKALDNTIKADRENLKKDKIIDEMAKAINEAYFASGDFEVWFEDKICKVQRYEDYTYLEKDIKQYFERKVEE